MNKLLKLSCLSLFLALVICSCSSQKKYSYETVPNDIISGYFGHDTGGTEK